MVLESMASVIWKNTEWEGCHSPIGDSIFGKAESEFGVVFPKDYKACAQLCHGGRPNNNAFAFDDPDVGRMESCIGVLLSYSEGDPENIFAAYARLRDSLPAGAVPIADDGGGDFVCLDYSRGEAPTIGYWHHGESGLLLLAPSFEAFLDMLYDESPEFQPQR